MPDFDTRVPQAIRDYAASASVVDIATGQTTPLGQALAVTMQNGIVDPLPIPAGSVVSADVKNASLAVLISRGVRFQASIIQLVRDFASMLMASKARLCRQSPQARS
jgi:hypothetical protein